MKIAFDSQIFALQQYGGISRYCCELASALEKIAGIEPRILAPMNKNSYLEALPRHLKRGYQPLFWTHFKTLQKIAAVAYEELALGIFGPDIIHETYYSTKPAGRSKAPRVLTIYDMIHERFPENFSSTDGTASNKAVAAARADHVICISEATRRDAIEFLGISESKVTVVHLAASALAAGIETSTLRSPDIGPYILYVGARNGYKNFQCLIAALAGEVFLKNIKVVCFGGGAFTKAERQMFIDNGLPAEMVHQASGDDASLAEYYTYAECFVYPSLYEGFGIPPLEAMARRCPVICSDRSSIPEVVGNAGEYFDPSDPSSLTKALLTLLTNSQRRDELIRRGHLRQSMFSWERCARETAVIYRSLLR